MSTIKIVSTNTMYYTISTLVLRASSLFFFPLFSSFLVQSDYGALSIVQSLVLIIGLIGGLGLNNAITRFIYSKSQNTKNNDSTVIYTALISSIVSQTTIVLVLLLIGPFLLKPVLKDIPFYPYVFIGLITIPINTFIDIARSYFKAVHEGKKVFILDMSFYSMNIMFNILFVVGFGFDVLGILLGVLVNTLLFTIILIVLFYRKFSISYDKKLVTEILKYSIPLVPFIILNMIFDSVDKFFLNSEIGVEASGIYYIALTFAAIFSSVKESIISALTPWVYAKINSQVHAISKAFNMVIVIIGFIGICVSFLANDILTILSSNSELLAASKYIPLVVISFYIIFLGQLLNIKTYYFGNYSKLLFIATLIGIIVEIISCYFLIPEYKILGAALSRILAFSAQTLLFLYFSRLEKESIGLYNYNFLFLSLILMSVIIVLPFFIELKVNLFISIIIKSSVLLLIFGIVLFAFKNDFQTFIKLFRGKNIDAT
jgi:O-antigen/teichoic acid export membrane protein